MPTSRATRVTSEANELSWSTIEFTVLADAEELALERPALDVERHRSARGRPWPRRRCTRATSLVGWTRSPIRVLTELIEAAQEPAGPAQAGPLGDPPFLADREADPLELAAPSPGSAR